MADPDLHKVQKENAELRRAVSELTVLNDIAIDIGALTDLESVMQRIISRSARAVEAEQGMITLIEEDEATRGHTLVRTIATSSAREPFHLAESVIGWMQLYRKPLRLNDPRSDGRFPPEHWEADTRSVLSVPLMVRSRLIGVLALYNKRSDDGFTAADERLLSIIAMQSAQVIENARLYEEEQALQRVQQELRTAFEIQSNLLPKAPPKLEGFDVAGRTIPAREVGGDFFDHLPLGDSRIGLCVGDVSGKGLPAALLMASTLATIRSYAARHISPAATMSDVNRVLYNNVKRGNFVTLFLGELDVSTGVLRYVNAGHNRPILLRRNGFTAELGKGGIALGIVPHAEYDEEQVEMAPDELLVIYSDGVTEAMSAEREQFGDERLVRILQSRRSEHPATLISTIIETLGNFAKHETQSDDITLLLARRYAV